MAISRTNIRFWRPIAYAPFNCMWEVLDAIYPALIYSDNSHIMNLDQMIKHPNEPIPIRKVLETLLESVETKWPKFLQRANDYGLLINELIIGLKGWLFVLMSWAFQKYFVFTEYFS